MCKGWVSDGIRPMLYFLGRSGQPGSRQINRGASHHLWATAAEIALSSLPHAYA